MSHQREERVDYHSYLLRLWHTHSGDGPVWRATLEEPLTQEIWRFDDLPALFRFLHTQIAPSGSRCNWIAIRSGMAAAGQAQ